MILLTLVIMLLHIKFLSKETSRLHVLFWEFTWWLRCHVSPWRPELFTNHRPEATKSLNHCHDHPVAVWPHKLGFAALVHLGFTPSHCWKAERATQSKCFSVWDRWDARLPGLPTCGQQGAQCCLARACWCFSQLHEDWQTVPGKARMLLPVLLKFCFILNVLFLE